MNRPALWLLCLLCLSASSCASVQRVGWATLDCAAPALLEHAKAAAPAVIDALAKPTGEWSEALDRVVLAAGDAGLCAVRAVLAELEGAPAPATSWTSSLYTASPGELARARAAKWLDANGLEP